MSSHANLIKFRIFDNTFDTCGIFVFIQYTNKRSRYDNFRYYHIAVNAV